MLRSFVLGGCVIASLAGCAISPQPHANTAANTALTSACLAAQLPPCTIANPPDVQERAAEAKAAAMRAEAQRSSDAATKDAVQRSSCLTDVGPRVPLTPDQCAAYVRSYSSKDIDRTGQQTAAGALRMLDPEVTIQQH
jgi:hypothetical protein